MKKINRIITPLIAVATGLIAYFLPMFRVYASSSLLTDTDGSKKNLLSYLGLRQYLSIDYIVGIVRGKHGNELLRAFMDTIGKNEEDRANLRDIVTSIDWLYAFFAFLCVFAVILLAIVVLSAIGKTPRTSLIVSGVALLDLGAMYLCFSQFAKPFLEGYINLNSFVDILGSQDSETATLTSLLKGLNISGILTNAMEVNSLALSIAFMFSVVLVALIFILACVSAYSKD